LSKTTASVSAEERRERGTERGRRRWRGEERSGEKEEAMGKLYVGIRA
jgi:hypothetical protein